jgi:hypothetical protein
MFLQGGLGNQLFQWSYSKYVESLTGSLFNYSDLLLKLPLPGVTRRKVEIIKLLTNRRIISSPQAFLKLLESKTSVNKKLLFTDTNLKGNYAGIKQKVFLGFFQSHIYIDLIWQELAKELRNLDHFKFNNDSTEDYLSAHIRLGDYLFNSKTNNHHGTVTADYVVTALVKLREQLNLNKVKVITDSPEAINPYLKTINDNGFVTQLVSQNQVSDFHSLGKAKGIVISNSSFSWWAGYYANKRFDAKVVAPYPWFKSKDIEPLDLIPLNWQRCSK